MVGSNKDEGTFFNRQNATVDQFTSQSKQRLGELAEPFLKLYPASSNEEAVASSLKSFSDEANWHMRIFAESQAKLKKPKAYLYYFTREPVVAAGQPSRGASHTVEIAYVFHRAGMTPNTSDVDRKLEDAMSQYWVNFAATGDPNGKSLPAWPAIKDRKTGRAMILGDTVAAEARPIARGSRSSIRLTPGRCGREIEMVATSDQIRRSTQSTQSTPRILFFSAVSAVSALNVVSGGPFFISETAPAPASHSAAPRLARRSSPLRGTCNTPGWPRSRRRPVRRTSRAPVRTSDR